MPNRTRFYDFLKFHRDIILKSANYNVGLPNYGAFIGENHHPFPAILAVIFKSPKVSEQPNALELLNIIMEFRIL